MITIRRWRRDYIPACPADAAALVTVTTVTTSWPRDKLIKKLRVIHWYGGFKFTENSQTYYKFSKNDNEPPGLISHWPQVISIQVIACDSDLPESYQYYRSLSPSHSHRDQTTDLSAGFEVCASCTATGSPAAADNRDFCQ
eukprot:g14162.t1